MIFDLYRSYLPFLGLLLAWNLWAARPASDEKPWEKWSLIPLQLLLTAVLLRDRLQPGEAPWLALPAVAALFPLAFTLGLMQNLHAIRTRGARLTDIPIVLFNVFVGICVALSGTMLVAGQGESPLLYSYSLVQSLVGSYRAHALTLCWHLPILVRRRPATSIPAAMTQMIVPAFAALCVLILLFFHGKSGELLASFAREPELRRQRPELRVGVLVRADHLQDPTAPGGLTAWVLPADHDGAGLPAPDRPLVLTLRAPDDWYVRRVAVDEGRAAFLEGARRLAARLRPEVLVPFPEPDGEAVLVFDQPFPAAEWRELFADVKRQVAEVSPDTRVAVRLAGVGARSRELFLALADTVDVAGPRLHPGGLTDGGAVSPAADRMLETWRTWRGEVPSPPAFWILAAGCSHLAYGEWAQARFLEGCLARAAADDRIEGVLIEGWRDRGHTQGIVRRSGDRRRAGERLEALLGRP